nr:hypothetical protein [Tanacetum cinerariifolium]
RPRSALAAQRLPAPPAGPERGANKRISRRLPGRAARRPASRCGAARHWSARPQRARRAASHQAAPAAGRRYRANHV